MPNPWLENKRLVNNGYPPAPPSEAPPQEIWTTSQATCLACQKIPVLKELAHFTKGRCFDCFMTAPPEPHTQPTPARKTQPEEDLGW